jgi:hypothetical protein
MDFEKRLVGTRCGSAETFGLQTIGYGTIHIAEICSDRGNIKETSDEG